MTAKEKELLNQPKKLMGGIKYKESWIDKFRYEKVKLQRFIERGRPIRDNAGRNEGRKRDKICRPNTGNGEIC